MTWFVAAGEPRIKYATCARRSARSSSDGFNAASRLHCQLLPAPCLSPIYAWAGSCVPRAEQQSHRSIPKPRNTYVKSPYTPSTSPAPSSHRNLNSLNSVEWLPTSSALDADSIHCAQCLPSAAFLALLADPTAPPTADSSSRASASALLPAHNSRAAVARVKSPSFARMRPFCRWALGSVSGTSGHECIKEGRVSPLCSQGARLDKAYEG